MLYFGYVYDKSARKYFSDGLRGRKQDLVGAKWKDWQVQLEKNPSNDGVVAQHVQANCVPYMFPAQRKQEQKQQND
jgi:hypothetical protein